MMRDIFGNLTCYNCDKDGIDAKIIVHDSPIGILIFCNQDCACEYLGLEKQPDGYYGFSPLDDDAIQEYNNSKEMAE